MEQKKRDELLIIDQQAAHERVLYEKYIAAINSKPLLSQQDLFPQAIEFSVENFVLLKEIESEVRAMGFDIREFGKNTFVVHGIPAGIETGNIKRLMEDIIEQFKHNVSVFRNNKAENIARALSKSLSVKRGMNLSSKEIKQLTIDLFRSGNPGFTAYGKPVFFALSATDIEKRFK